MFAGALVGAALLIGAAGPVAEYVSPSGHVAGSAAEAIGIGSGTQGAGAGKALAALVTRPVAADDEAPKETLNNGGGAGKAVALATPMPCPGTETFAV
jgi:hypothetical protein